MAYEPTKGIIVNGRIIDADDLMNEFTAISVATKENSTKSTTEAEQARVDAVKHTDDKFSALNIDGGTF